jgi:c-di-GMP-related signal transduction protein
MNGNFMVGRQPIFDAKLDVFGYELLFRNRLQSGWDGDAMTAAVMVCAGLDVGLQNIVGTRLAFVNASRSFLVGDQEVPLPATQTVIEVLEDVAHDDEVLDGCRRLVGNGYRLALDDYVWVDGDEALLELASIVKLDVLAIPAADLGHQVERCSAFGAQLLAEKVETGQQLAACRELGFELFQGYLLSRPEIVEGRTLTPSRLTCLLLIEKLTNSETSPRDLERIVETDAGLSYRFLLAAGSGAAGGLRRPVRSIRDGVVLLGRRRLRSWLILMLLSDTHQGSAEQLTIAMTRARMCELMAVTTGSGLQDSAFTIGLVSALDLLFGVALSEIVENLAITDELVDALLGHTGRLGIILRDVLGWELGAHQMDLYSGVDPVAMERHYLDALIWATDICGTLAQAA